MKKFIAAIVFFSSFSAHASLESEKRYLDGQMDEWYRTHGTPQQKEEREKQRRKEMGPLFNQRKNILAFRNDLAKLIKREIKQKYPDAVLDNGMLRGIVTIDKKDGVFFDPKERGERPNLITEDMRKKIQSMIQQLYKSHVAVTKLVRKYDYKMEYGTGYLSFENGFVLEDGKETFDKVR